MSVASDDDDMDCQPAEEEKQTTAEQMGAASIGSTAGSGTTMRAAIRNHKQNALPIDILALHSRRLSRYSEEREAVPKMRAQLATRVARWQQRHADLMKSGRLAKSLAATGAVDDINRAAVLTDVNKRTLKSLVQEKERLVEAQVVIEVAASSDACSEYLLDAIPFLNAHHAATSDAIALARKPELSVQLESKRREIHENIVACITKLFPEMVPALDKFNIETKTQCASDACTACGGEVVEAENSYYVCGDCGVVAHVGFSRTDVRANLNFEDTPMQKRQYTYNRLNHFREYLRQVQGDSRTVIPDTVYQQLISGFHKYRIKTTDIDARQVRIMLRRINKSNYYEHRESIATHLNPNYKPIRIDPLHQEKLCLMFVQLEEPFEEVKKKLGRRKNFLSYPFVYFKLNELNGWDQYNASCDLLKSVPLINRQDRWWGLMMEELGWENVGRTFDMHARNRSRPTKPENKS